MIRFILSIIVGSMLTAIWAASKMSRRILAQRAMMTRADK